MQNENCCNDLQEIVFEIFEIYDLIIYNNRVFFYLQNAYFVINVPLHEF